MCVLCVFFSDVLCTEEEEKKVDVGCKTLARSFAFTGISHHHRYIYVVVRVDEAR